MRELAPDLWVVDREFAAGAVRLGGRMTVVRLRDGSLWLHSPVALSPALADALEELGPVRYIVAPSCFHHLFVRPYLDRWPRACAYGAPGLLDKREDVAWTSSLDASMPWTGEIEQLLVAGCPKVNEVVFFHPRSRTLIVTDLVFNVEEYQGMLTGLALRMIGAHRRLAQTRTWRWLFVKDRAAAAESVAKMFAWDFDRVVMCHGAVVERDGQAAMREALHWMRSG